MPEPAFNRQPLNIHQLRKNISGSTPNYIRSIEPFTHIAAGTICAVSITLIYTGTASLTSIAATHRRLYGA